MPPTAEAVTQVRLQHNARRRGASVPRFFFHKAPLSGFRSQHYKQQPAKHDYDPRKRKEEVEAIAQHRPTLDALTDASLTNPEAADHKIEIDTVFSDPTNDAPKPALRLKSFCSKPCGSAWANV